MKKTALITLFLIFMAISAFCYQSGNSYAIPRGNVITNYTPNQSCNCHSIFSKVKHRIRKVTYNIHKTTVKTVRKVRYSTTRGIHNVQRVTNKVFKKIRNIVTPKHKYRHRKSCRATHRKPLLKPE